MTTAPISDDGAFTDVGALADIPQRGARTVRTPAGDIAVFRTGDDRVFALADHCPHKGGRLSQGIVHGHAVTCPLHGLVIALDTGAAEMPEDGCAPRYRVRIENGRILLGGFDHVGVTTEDCTAT